MLHFFFIFPFTFLLQVDFHMKQDSKRSETQSLVTTPSKTSKMPGLSSLSLVALKTNLLLNKSIQLIIVRPGLGHCDSPVVGISKKITCNLLSDLLVVQYIGRAMPVQ